MHRLNKIIANTLGEFDTADFIGSEEEAWRIVAFIKAHRDYCIWVDDLLPRATVIIRANEGSANTIVDVTMPLSLAVSFAFLQAEALDLNKCQCCELLYLDIGDDGVCFGCQAELLEEVAFQREEDLDDWADERLSAVDLLQSYPRGTSIQRRKT